MTNGSNDIVQKFKSLGLGSQIILGAALVLFIASFLAWGNRDILGFEVPTNDSAWGGDGAIFSMLAVLLGLATAGVILVRMFASAGTLPDNIGGITWPKIHLGLGAAVVVLVLLRFLIDGDIEIGLILGLISAGGLAAGGFLMFQEEQKGTAA